jgi:hypothetical protein
MRLRAIGVVLGCCSLAGFPACAGSANPASPSSGASAQLTQAQITTLSSAVAPAVVLALSGALSGLSNGLFSTQRSTGLIRPESTTYPVNASVPCESSGTITVSGSWIDNTNGSGPGSMNANLAVGFSNCTEAGVRLQSNPGLTVGIAMPFANLQVVSQTTTLGGGILFTMDGATGSAAFNCTQTIAYNNPLAASWTGSVSVQYPSGQTPTTISCSTF